MNEQRQSQVTGTNSKPAKNGRANWTPLPLEHLPLPTYWPAGLAFGLMFIFWGILTSWVLLAVGIVIFISSLAGWIQDIRHERKHSTSTSSH